MEPYLKLEEKLQKLSKLKDKEFTFKMSNHKLDCEISKNDYDFSIITVKSKATWLDLDSIEGIKGLKLSLYDGTITALFSITYYN
tara:strand:+ start:296 stop:550 length:255 start_codon:yes stop_codon:yes gene_type:complete